MKFEDERKSLTSVVPKIDLVSSSIDDYHILKTACSVAFIEAIRTN